eukprot:908905-Amphidinium_carterae.1
MAAFGPLVLEEPRQELLACGAAFGPLVLEEPRQELLVDGLMASVCLWRTVSSPCGACMCIPLATDMQVEVLGAAWQFTITPMPSEALENDIVVSSVVHCTPELQQGMQFLDQ